MATYDFATLIATGNKTQAFFTTDKLTFNDSISAADLIVSTSGSNTTIKLATGFTLTLSNFSQKQIASINFVFANGTKLAYGDDSVSIANDDLANTLIGTDYNDYLDGALGNDTVSYATASFGVTVDLSLTTAQDTVGAGVDKILNIENITGSNFSDTLYGDANNNLIDGGAGIDVMDGRNGSDTYVATAGDVITDSGTTGTDVVTSATDYVLGTGIENLVLTGTTAIYGKGNSLNNTITGNNSNNILDGGSGTDTFSGGLGNDSYLLDNAADLISGETSSGGTDWVISSASSFDLSTQALNVENMRLVSSAVSGTGNSLANILIGNSGNNTLTGGAGADALLGGFGNDTLIGGVSTTASDNSIDTLTGGVGNDTYYVTDVTDIVVEAISVANLLDTVFTTVNYALNDTKSAGVDILTLSGTSDLTGYGNSQANTINGNSGSNVLCGSISTTTGDGKIDTLIGGLGNDSYYVTDSVDVVTEAANQGTDTVNSIVTYALNDTTSVGVENLTLNGTANINGTGNSLNNTLTGNLGNNLLDGGVGADTLIGGIGNDTYMIDNAGDTVQEKALSGTDTIISKLTYTLSSDAVTGYVENLTLTGSNGTTSSTDALNGTGNSLDNTITGNDGNNTLIGGDGVDNLIGGAGNDLLVSGTTDVGTVASSIQPDADFMSGGSGDDTYSVDFSTDTITELANQGTDLVKSRVTFTLANNVENLTLTGSSGNTTDTNAINGTGNALNNILIGNAGVNSLSGMDGNDLLDGGIGADSLFGGNGNDTYMVDNIGDVVNETANTSGADAVASTVVDANKDTVNASLATASQTYVLSDVLVENLTLTGSVAINGTGNSSANILTGNTANNVLDAKAGNDVVIGGQGKDTMTGGTGADMFAFTSTTDSTNANFDVITDFSQTDLDKIDLSGIAASTLSFGGLKSGTPTTVSATNRVDYYISAGNIFLIGDNDGNASTIDFKIQLTGFTGTLTTNDFVLSRTQTGTSGNDTLFGGVQNDTLTGGAGADSISGGLGNDTFVFATRADTQSGFAAANTTAANIDKITDFYGNGALAGDTIKLGIGSNAFGSSLTFTATTTATVTAVTVATAVDFTALTNAVQSASAGVASSASSAQVYDVTVTTGTLAGNYLIVNDNTATINTSDTIISLTGVNGALNSQDFIFG